MGAGLIAVLGVGCGSSGGGLQSSRVGDNVLAGTWTRTGLSASGRSVSCPNTLTVNNIQVDSCTDTENITFNTDGTYTLSFPAPRFVRRYTESGTYSYRGGTLTLNRTRIGFDGNGDGVIDPATEVTAFAAQTLVASVTLSGNSFTFTPTGSPSLTSYTYPVSIDGTTPVVSTFTFQN